MINELNKVCLYVIKRNGDKVEYDSSKIESAISRAIVASHTNEELALVANHGKVSSILMGNIEDRIKSNMERGKPGDITGPTISVEQIQDIVEDCLILSRDTKTAKAYIRYRYIHNEARTGFQKVKDIIESKLYAKDVKHQNANVDEVSFGGRKGEAINAVLKEYALDYSMSKMASDNHRNNQIYIHDLDSYSLGMHNCMSIPFDKLLKDGFNTRQTDVRGAKSFATAAQLTAVIIQLQSLQQFGGVAATHYDYTMVPYMRMSFWKYFFDEAFYHMSRKQFELVHDVIVNKGISVREQSIETSDFEELFKEDIKKFKENEDTAEMDKDIDFIIKRTYEISLARTIKEVYQSIEGLYHNLNTLQSRSGNQLPFSSLNYGSCTSFEGRVIIKALLDNLIKGIGKLHRTSSFPCGIFKCSKEINTEPGTPNYDLFRLALKSTAKRLYPNYANLDWSGNAGYDKSNPEQEFATMGKRLLM